MLEELEDEKLNDIDFIELNACTGGCVGGVLTVENPFVARARLQRLRRYLPVSCNHLEDDEIPREMYWQRPLEASSVLKLADNVIDAMKRMNELNDCTSGYRGWIAAPAARLPAGHSQRISCGAWPASRIVCSS